MVKKTEKNPEKRGPGRPPSGGPTPMRSIRVADELWQQIGQAAELSGQKVGPWIVKVLQRASARRIAKGRK